MTAMVSKVTKTRHVATARKPEQKRQIAKATKAKKAGVKVAKQSRPAAKQQQAVRVATTVQPRKALPVEPRPVELPPQILRQRPVWDNELAYISVPRCR